MRGPLDMDSIGTMPPSMVTVVGSSSSLYDVYKFRGNYCGPAISGTHPFKPHQARHVGILRPRPWWPQE